MGLFLTFSFFQFYFLNLWDYQDIIVLLSIDFFFFFGVHISSLISHSLIFYPIRSLEIFDPKRRVEEKYFKESFVFLCVKVN